MINAQAGHDGSANLFDSHPGSDQLNAHHHHLSSPNSIQTSSPSATTAATTLASATLASSHTNNNNNNTLYNTAGGFLSRSNSQPDLTINMEKLLPSTANYNSYFYNTSCVATGGPGGNMPAAANALLNNPYGVHNPAGHYQMNCGMMMNGNGAATVMGAAPHHMHHQLGAASNKMMRRYPSCTFKTPSDPCHNEPAENEYFSSFNVGDLGNGGGGGGSMSNVMNEFGHHHHHHHASVADSGVGGSTVTSGGVFNAASTYSATTSGVSSSTSLTTTSLDDGLLVGIDLFDEHLPDLEDLMSLVTFDSGAAAVAASQTTAVDAASNFVCSSSSSSSSSSNGGGGSVLRHSSAPAAAIEEALIAVAHQHQSTSSTIPSVPDSLSIKQQPHQQMQMYRTDGGGGMIINSNQTAMIDNAGGVGGGMNSNSYFEYNDIESLVSEQTMTGSINMNANVMSIGESCSSNGSERVSRSAPPSPTIEQKKKQKNTVNLQW
jgi:hypothetical protein